MDMNAFAKITQALSRLNGHADVQHTLAAVTAIQLKGMTLMGIDRGYGIELDAINELRNKVTLTFYGADVSAVKLGARSNDLTASELALSLDRAADGINELLDNFDNNRGAQAA